MVSQWIAIQILECDGLDYSILFCEAVLQLLFSIFHYISQRGRNIYIQMMKQNGILLISIVRTY